MSQEMTALVCLGEQRKPLKLASPTVSALEIGARKLFSVSQGRKIIFQKMMGNFVHTSQAFELTKCQIPSLPQQLGVGHHIDRYISLQLSSEMCLQCSYQSVR